MTWSQGLEEGSPAFEIAASENPHVRVVAGPGTGKSFAMKRRVARLLETGIDPMSILPVTFTRVAAEDLHRELVGMGVEGCDRLRGTTLHSLALRTLTRNHVLAATGRSPRPLNDFETKPLEVDLGAHGGLREIRRKVRAYESAWARLQHDEPGFARSAEDVAFANDLVQWLLFHEAMLIGEVIPQFYEYLRSNPAAPERTEYTHILVDEYQDLNKAEQSAIELLSDRANVCIVGDDDQSIYSFKHAHPEGIREWVEINAGAEDITLVECRRCPTRVVDMANSLIAHNRMRPEPRQLVPRVENGEGDVRIVQYVTLDDEIEGVATTIAEMIEAGTPPGDILVLAQRGVIGTPIFEKLVEEGIPVRSYYAEAELDAEEAQRRFALLKLFVNRNDRVALRWLLGLDSDNWRAPAYRRIRERCDADNSSPWEVLSDVADGNYAMPHVDPLVARFREVRDQLDELEQCPDIGAAIDHIFPDGFQATRELREVALTVLDELGEENRTRFLPELVSAITTPEVPSEIEDVRIMSLHKSKGLSAPVTIIAGCVEGLLPMRPNPSQSAQDRAAYLEEQRRLFYVGISRVKASPGNGQPGTLILTYSQRMPSALAKRARIIPAKSNYRTANLNASRFIAELGTSSPQPVAG
jgi:DNA helicase II / ATP-dependent DNA helicase PcrA